VADSPHDTLAEALRDAGKWRERAAAEGNYTDPAAERTLALLAVIDAATITCPRCDGQTYDVGACGLCANVGLLDVNGDRLALAALRASSGRHCTCEACREAALAPLRASSGDSEPPKCQHGPFRTCAICEPAGSGDSEPERIHRKTDGKPSDAMPQVGFADWREQAEWWQQTCEWWHAEADRRLALAAPVVSPHDETLRALAGIEQDVRFAIDVLEMAAPPRIENEGHFANRALTYLHRIRDTWLALAGGAATERDNG
jgi:hypothetical protein